MIQAQKDLNQIEHLYDHVPQKIIIKLTTQQSAYSIQIQQLQINSDMTSQNLNQMLNNLIDSNHQHTPLNFHFLVEGTLLRGSLKSHLVRYNLLSQNIISVEYVLAFGLLKQQQKVQQQDWISCMTNLITTKQTVIGVGLYSGTLSFYNQELKPLNQLKVSNYPLKSIKSIGCVQQNQYYVISGGLQEQVALTKVKCDGQTCSLQLVSEMVQQGSILGIQINPVMDGLFCTVGSSNNLMIWKIHETDEQTEVIRKPNKKKIVHKTNPILTQEATFGIHQSSIESVCWMNNNTIITGSSDHSIKLYDLEKQSEIITLLTKDSITVSLDCTVNQILSAHEDGYIRLWDPRNNQTPSITYHSHSKLASCLQFHRNHNIFASASYDTTIKIWDIRSIFPLQNISTHLDKVMSVMWTNQKQLLSGGTDQSLIIHQL